jgi:hypothetical protein
MMKLEIVRTHRISRGFKVLVIQPCVHELEFIAAEAKRQS